MASARSTGEAAPSLPALEEVLRLRKILLRALPPAAAAGAAAGSAAGTGAAAAGGGGSGGEEVDVETVLHALSALNTINVNRSLLAKSRIGVAVGALRRHKHAEIQNKSAALVNKWKACIAHQTPRGVQKTSSSSTPGESAANASPPLPSGSTTSSSNSNNNSSSSRSSSSSSSKEEGPRPLPPFPGPTCGDPTRDKARSFLWRALVEGLDAAAAATATTTAAAAAAAAGSTATSEETGRLAASIEEALWQRFVVEKQSMRDYNTQLKTLKWNLADPKNPDLNLKVLWCIYTPEQLAEMSSAELASDAKKQEREQQKQQSLEACQSDWEVRRIINSGEANNGQFPCFKCKTNKTVYFQMQTRSSDEPMTTFVTCLECGNRWKF